MNKSVSNILTKSANPQNMSYYQMIRNTIHGLDKLIVTVIHQSVTIITGCLTLSILLYEKIDNRIHASCLSIILIIIAFLITRNSHKRIKFYTNLMAENIKIAEDLEDLLISENRLKITKIIEIKVKYAGRKGVRIFRKSIVVFYAIESGLGICLVFNLLPLNIREFLIKLAMKLIAILAIVIL